MKIINREIKKGRKFKLVKYKHGYTIVVDSVINGVDGHHIQDGQELGGMNCMTCTERMFNRYLSSGILL